jgi:superfamily II DNA or RNA helicase
MTPTPHALRPYQSAAIAGVRNAMATGHRRVVLTVPTGGGKTLIASEIIKRSTERGFKVLFIAPRRELILQALGALAKHGVSAGVIMAGARHLTRSYEAVQIASADTIHARVVRNKRMELPPADLVIFDEFHLAVAATRAELLSLYPNAKIIGLTATPARGDGRGLNEVADALVLGPSIPDLVTDGFLVPLRYFAPSAPDLSKIKVVKGDYVEKQLGEVMIKLVGDVVENWLRLAPERRTVVFCCNCAHSRAVRDAFLAEGIKAEHVDGETPNDERAEILARVASGETQVLTNVYVASYGLDIPALDCAVLARPTKNITLYLQTVGRVMRPFPGKVDALVIDHAGAVHENGFADDVHPWSLEGAGTVKERKLALAKESGEPKEITCSQCKAVFAGRRDCPCCGFQMIPPAKPIPTYEADLQEVKRGKAKENREMTWDEKAVFMGELKQYAREHAFKPGWAAMKYRDRTGVFPNDPRVKNAPMKICSNATERWVRSQNIRWHKGKEKAERAQA